MTCNTHVMDPTQSFSSGTHAGSGPCGPNSALRAERTVSAQPPPVFCLLPPPAAALTAAACRCAHDTCDEQARCCTNCSIWKVREHARQQNCRGGGGGGGGGGPKQQTACVSTWGADAGRRGRTSQPMRAVKPKGCARAMPGLHSPGCLATNNPTSPTRPPAACPTFLARWWLFSCTLGGLFELRAMPCASRELPARTAADAAG